MDKNHNRQKEADAVYDLAIIGGGINGTGIARDAALRGLKICLIERDDLGSQTSSNSTKLIHGGLRYLEFFDFRLVRHALIERALLTRMLHKFVRPMRFIIPVVKGGRSSWLLRLGLFIYDHLGPLGGLAKTKSLALKNSEYGLPLKDHTGKAFEYSDCWVDDARLVIFNAIEAAAVGGDIWTRTSVSKARREEGFWQVLFDDGREIKARALVNATGPFVNKVCEDVLDAFPPLQIRLVKGSHIVTKRLFDHGTSYMLQQEDGRIIFVIPFEGRFTLIGTTEEEFNGDPGSAQISDSERDYLIAAVNKSFKRSIATDDICWSFSGVRPLIQDGTKSAREVSRGYELFVEAGADSEGRALPLLTVYGGKLTTFRVLSEQAVDKLAEFFPSLPGTSTDRFAYSAFDRQGFDTWERKQFIQLSFLPRALLERWVKAYGRRVEWFTKNINSVDDLGEDFGAGLFEREVRYLIEHEWAQRAEDILWRRTKCGLHMSAQEIARFEDFMKNL